MSRVAAADLVLLTAHGGADLDSALEASDQYSPLEGPDRGFARAMASAALRALGRIDLVLSGVLDRPLERIDPPVLALLRVGCAQLFLMGIQDYACVSATVEAARRWRPASRGGALVNAILRRAASEPRAFLEAPATSIWPDWLAAYIRSSIGEPAACAIAELQLEEPPIDLSLQRGERAADWADRLGATALPNGSVRLETGRPISELPGYAEGRWWVQDAGATLAAGILGDVRDKHVTDLCAAPGGKAMQLASAGAKVTALDISRQRLDVVKRNAARLSLPMTIVEADARGWRPEQLQDAVLLDAPCSALGVLRRHPEGAWRRDPADLARFPKTQASLLDAAWEMLRPDGVLSYCVCTPSPEEGVDVIEAAIRSGRWERRPIAPDETPGFSHAVTPAGDLLTIPPPALSVAGASSEVERDLAASSVTSDVFFVARLVRRS